MNPEIKARWVAELRSGNYTQTRSVLRDRRGYCCLGVLCAIAVADGVIAPPEWAEGAQAYRHVVGEDSWLSLLPDKVMDWAGLDDALPTVGGIALHMYNDSGGTFEAIADVIEEGL